MPNMELITSVTVGAGGAASVTLPGTGTIPQTYKDLKLVVSARSNANGDFRLAVFPNGSTSSLSSINLYSTGGGTGRASYSGGEIGFLIGANDQTSDTFGNGEIYFSEYANTSRAKSFSLDGVTENNATTAYNGISNGQWASNNAITTLVLQPTSGSFVAGSTFYLYGISDVQSSPKATGGIVTQDTNYWYHMFPFTGTFTPTQALTADVLLVAGGGGGGTPNYGGGGGAGGLRGFTNQSFSTVAHTVTIGAGGAAGGGGGARGTNGGATSITGSGFTTIAATGGGGGGGDNNSSGGTAIGASGGSGGGNYSNATGSGGAGNAGGYSPSEGNNGGSGSGNAAGSYAAGGGGGAGGAANTTFGYGGVGSSAYSSWGIATYSGHMVGGTAYFAGGGGGGGGGGLAGGYGANLGGFGGGGDSGVYSTASFASKPGLANTGGGGGGGGASSSSAGGSGIVIVRYAK